MVVVLCLGELSVAMPYTGAFHVYAKRYIGPATALLVAILYWLTWTVALGSEFTAAGLIMQKWFPDTPVWLWSLAFIILIFLTNAFSVRVFAESEYYFSLVKVLAIVVFILLGGAAIIGIFPYAGFSHAPGLSNLTKNGWFPNGFGGLFYHDVDGQFCFFWDRTHCDHSRRGQRSKENYPQSDPCDRTALRVIFYRKYRCHGGVDSLSSGGGNTKVRLSIFLSGWNFLMQLI